jgi:hypothetical protein
MMKSNWFWRRRRTDQINPDQINIVFDARRRRRCHGGALTEEISRALLC